MSDEETPTKIGDYEIEGLLGEGGMAKVYRARHAILETVHAVKVLDPSYRVNAEARKRFLDEAKIQAKHLDHGNIVKVTNIVATAEHAALVMELIDGPSLEAKIAELKLKPAEVKRIMFAVLDAVGYAHAAGIIHRDLKPANVLLANKDGVLIPKVTDFGIAKVTAANPGGAAAKKSTHGGARMGTLSYSSPEQIRRAKDVTPRSDVFSLGAMLYEMATGEMAFGGDSDYDVMENIVNGRFIPPDRRYDKIDPVLARVIQQALSPDPAARFASCAEMAAALRGEGAVVLAPVVTAAKIAAEERAAVVEPARPQSKLPMVLALVAGAAALAGVALFLAMRKTDEPKAAPPKPAPPEISVASPVEPAKADPWEHKGTPDYDPTDAEFPKLFEQIPTFATTTASGLGYLPLKGSETGPHPGAGDAVMVNYKLWKIASHQLVDSNVGKQPSAFVLTMVKPGMREAFRLLATGQTARFWIPAKLSNAGDGAMLMDAELVSIQSSACTGEFYAGEDLAMTLTGDAKGACGNYVFIDTSTTNHAMCAGTLVCDGRSSSFSCTYSNMQPAVRLKGTMHWSCDGTGLTATITMGTSSKIWTLSPDTRPHP